MYTVILQGFSAVEAESPLEAAQNIAAYIQENATSLSYQVEDEQTDDVKYVDLNNNSVHEPTNEHPTFPKDFVSWYETFYEMVAGFYSNPDNEFLNKIENDQGRGGMWELAKDLTDKFEKKYQDTPWGDEGFDYYESIDKFLEEELK